VATELSREALQRLARLGAQKRLEELRQEEAAIRAAFPDLDDSRSPRRGRGGRRRGAGAPSTAEATGAPAAARKAKRRRTPMTAAQKRAVSERMKKYWAARRKEKG
jgi:hypothetical protein